MWYEILHERLSGRFRKKRPKLFTQQLTPVFASNALTAANECRNPFNQTWTADLPDNPPKDQVVLAGFERRGSLWIRRYYTLTPTVFLAVRAVCAFQHLPAPSPPPPPPTVPGG